MGTASEGWKLNALNGLNELNTLDGLNRKRRNGPAGKWSEPQRRRQREPKSGPFLDRFATGFGGLTQRRKGAQDSPRKIRGPRVESRHGHCRRKILPSSDEGRWKP